MPNVTVVRDGNFIGVVGPDDRVVKRAAARERRMGRAAAADIRTISI
jgi:hypothetical protein